MGAGGSHGGVESAASFVATSGTDGPRPRRDHPGVSAPTEPTPPHGHSVRRLSWATVPTQIAEKLMESFPVTEKEGFEPSMEAFTPITP